MKVKKSEQVWKIIIEKTTEQIRIGNEEVKINPFGYISPDKVKKITEEIESLLVIESNLENIANKIIETYRGDIKKAREAGIQYERKVRGAYKDEGYGEQYGVEIENIGVEDENLEQFLKYPFFVRCDENGDITESPEILSFKDIYYKAIKGSKKGDDDKHQEQPSREVLKNIKIKKVEEKKNKLLNELFKNLNDIEINPPQVSGYNNRKEVIEDMRKEWILELLKNQRVIERLNSVSSINLSDSIKKTIEEYFDENNFTPDKLLKLEFKFDLLLKLLKIPGRQSPEGPIG